MSNKVNDALLEKAADLMEYWSGTMHDRIIARDLASSDLEALKYHVDLAWKEMQLQEEEFEYADVE
jgi:hypothetical protein